jgi:predicted TIM-barrel fold metal-dependent hydrolase
MLSFDEVPKIDAHLHFNTDRPALIEQAKTDHFHLLTINTEVPFFPDINQQSNIARAHSQEPLDYITTFSTKNWGIPGWQQQAIQKIQHDIDHGAVGVKVWKNIGMALQADEGQFIMIDDPSFSPILDYLEQHSIPLLAHLGEPKNCWLPVEEMTVSSDRDYFQNHPEYHMYKHPEYPSYEQQIQARDRMLENHPDLRFIGAHLASLEWSVGRLANWLDRFPNTAVDLAERICHLQHQAVDDYDKVRNFLINYQDRILYGTDVIDCNEKSAAQLKKHIHNLWSKHWHFFQSSDLIQSTKVSGTFKGMQLPDQVMKKIFGENALRWYPSLDNRAC